VGKIARDIDSKIAVSLLARGEPTETDMENPSVKLFESVMKKVLHRKILVRDKYGSSDARHFSKLDIPVLMTKPIGGKIHGPDEYISLVACEQYYLLVESFLKDYQQLVRGGDGKYGITEICQGNG